MKCAPGYDVIIPLKPLTVAASLFQVIKCTSIQNLPTLVPTG